MSLSTLFSAKDSSYGNRPVYSAILYRAGIIQIYVWVYHAGDPAYGHAVRDYAIAIAFDGGFFTMHPFAECLIDASPGGNGSYGSR